MRCFESRQILFLLREWFLHSKFPLMLLQGGLENGELELMENEQVETEMEIEVETEVDTEMETEQTEFKALTGNRIINVPLVAEWLINNTTCSKCKRGIL